MPLADPSKLLIAPATSRRPPRTRSRLRDAVFKLTTAGTRIPVTTPTNYATSVKLPRPGNLAYRELADPLTVTALTAGGAASAATNYIVRNDRGAIIDSGPWSGSVQTIGTAGVAPYDRYGWHRIHLKGVNRADGKFNDDYGTGTFTIAKDKDPLIPRAPLRATNPPNQSDGLDAPAMHGYCSLGSFRVVASAQNLNPARQQASANVASASSVSATLTGGGFGGAVTVASMVVLVHTVVGDATGMTFPADGAPWNVGASVTVGAGATQVTTKVYYCHCANHTAWSAGGSFPTFVCSTTNPSKQSLVVVEQGPSVANTTALAFAVASGTGLPAVITKDMTAIAGGNEYGVIAAVSADQGSCTSDTGVPSVTPQFSQGQILNGSSDAYGGGNNHTITYQLAGSPTNWTAVFIAFSGATSYAAAIAAAKAQMTARYDAWGQYQDPNRPYRQVSIATLLETSAATVFHYLSQITHAVQDTISHIPGFVACYTSRNEPQFSYSMAENNAFCGAVYAGDASALAAVPGFVSLTLNAQPSFFTFVDAGMLDKATGGANAMHYHDYNMCDGDPAITLYCLRALKSGMAARSVDGLPIFMTEGGHDTNYWPGIFRIAHSGTAYMLNMIAREVILRVPYERQYWYYDQRAGFDSVNTWEMVANGLFPGFAMHRAYAAELYGKVIESELDFGDVYGRVVVGGVWRSPTDHTGLAVAIGAEGVPDQTFAVGGPLGAVPSTMTLVDCWGNETVVPVTGRTFTVPVGARPTMVKLPAGIGVAVRPTTFGRSWPSVPTVQYIDDGDGAALAARLLKLNDDDYLNPYAYSSSDIYGAGSLYSTTWDTTFPRHVEIMALFGQVMPVDTISAFLPTAWQAQGTILKGKLQYTLDGSSWLDATVKIRNPDGTSSTAAEWDITPVSIRNYDTSGDTLADAFTYPQQYFEADLGGVLDVVGIRVYAEVPTQGMYLDDVLSGVATGSTNAITKAIQPDVICVAELMAFNRSSHVVALPMAAA